ncbi:hypothetical protein [Arthrospira sp. PCC 8006]|uniref:hypothetical protein n=1 Tax=Oscillatoriales TaxID=1150 RepID=UPI00396F68ED
MADSGEGCGKVVGAGPVGAGAKASHSTQDKTAAPSPSQPQHTGQDCCTRPKPVTAHRIRLLHAPQASHSTQDKTAARAPSQPHTAHRIRLLHAPQASHTQHTG